MSLSVICIELRITLVISFCNVVEFEFCVIFVCYVLTISIEVKFSVNNFDGYKGFALYLCILWDCLGAKKAHVMERNTNASERGESEGASLWGDLD